MKVINMVLTNQEKLDIIGAFHLWYYNTDQEAFLFAVEYFYVVKSILKGIVPIQLKYLVDFKEDIINILEPNNQTIYKQALDYYKIN